jgi:hypothetical protein
MRYITLSWLDTSLAPTDRISMMWFANFSLWKWRYNLASSKTYSVNSNFISANSYFCAEICAHSLILIILHLSQIKKPELFLGFSVVNAMKNISELQDRAAHFSLVNAILRAKIS